MKNKLLNTLSVFAERFERSKNTGDSMTNGIQFCGYSKIVGFQAGDVFILFFTKFVTSRVECACWDRS